ncbi:lipase 3-like [Schistocerca cancellata]|uniref:lipase 3-like n=1 Tax=Schistocerca cancellata TaxID=274614 RepID=UPI0021174959|nr:lipase 3-like [Schistocerca cancellata]
MAANALLLLLLAASHLALCAAVSTDDYNPDVDLSTPGIIRRHGYPAEAHTVLTGDGYLLTMHRIPRPQPQGACRILPVVLQHGLLGSSTDWVFLGPRNGLAYRLYEAGYDVWMGNSRGNTYSRAHSNMSIHDSRFWDFSWHEMGVYDVPAVIGHVLRETGCPQLFYVGHSMGTTMFYVMGSERPDYNDKVRAMFSLAPVAYMSRVKSPIRYFAPAASDLTFFMHLFGHDEFLPQSKALRFLAKVACELTTIEEHVCENAMFTLVGFDEKQFNMTMLPVLLSHSPSGSSTKTLAHYAQEINSGKFRKYDYGKTGNMERYGTPEPPAYNISNMRAPISLHFASNDWLANIQDVEEFSLKLPNVVFSELVPLLSFNHLDFLLAKDVPYLVYDRVEQLMDKLQQDEWDLDDI